MVDGVFVFLDGAFALSTSMLARKYKVRFLSCEFSSQFHRYKARRNK